MKNFKISDRLEKVAKCVEANSLVADIGCDHAYTAIYLIKNNIAKKVIAMDINKGPLQKANYNIKSYKLEEYIETRLSDGGKELQKGEVDTILISGMGGRLTTRILEDSIEVVRECKQLVLQPQSEIYLVREFLHRIGFDIIFEDMIIDDGKYYVIINAKSNIYKRKNGIKIEDINTMIEDRQDVEIEEKNNSKLFDRYGKYLLENKNPTLYIYLSNQLNKIEQIYNNLLNDEDNACNNAKRINELKEDLHYIREGLKFYEL